MRVHVLVCVCRLCAHLLNPLKSDAKQLLVEAAQPVKYGIKRKILLQQLFVDGKVSLDQGGHVESQVPRVEFAVKVFPALFALGALDREQRVVLRAEGRVSVRY